ncbi:MAG TPA: NADPH-dependent FMN reductase [Solirubrobacteraceae bacterium]
MEILAICGSLRAGSTNEAVLRTAAVVAPPGVTVTLDDSLGALPHFNPDDDREPLHPAVALLRGRLGAVGAVFFCTPEYAGALPGSFKNLLDWTVGGGETYGKPVAYVNAAGPAAPAGGANATESLRKILGYTGAHIVEEACARVPITRDMVGDDGTIADAAAREQIAAAVTALAAAATRH